SPGASAHLDAIRAGAALVVMMDHLRALFFVDYLQLRQPPWFLKSIYFLTGFGHQAVMVFFVLSGFLISATIIKGYETATWSWRDYAINRSVRLYIVLIPALLLGGFCDVLGSTAFASSGLYTHPLSGLGPGIAAANLSVGTLLCNALFLQTVACHTLGSNGPLWSLSNEFWYYVLFPLALSATLAWARRAVRVGILLTLASLCLAWLLGLGMLIGFLVWMSGCVLVFAYSRVRLRKEAILLAYALASFCILGVCLVAARTSLGGALG